MSLSSRRLKIALKNGLRLVQLREKNYTREALWELALKMLPLMKQHGVRLIINADIEGISKNPNFSSGIT